MPISSNRFSSSKNFLTKYIQPIFLKSYLKTWDLVVFGSDNFSLISVKELYKFVGKFINKFEIVTVSCNTPVYNFAQLNGIKTYLWPPALNEPYDLGVVVSFGKFIPKRIIELFPLGIINVHPSLLPRWRGPMPIFHTLRNGDLETGVTIIKISHEKFDAGEIILQKTINIGKNELMPSLHNKLSKLGSECLLEVILNMPECLTKCIPQMEENALYAPKLKKGNVFVKWSEMTAEEIYNLYRAFFGSLELKTLWGEKQIKLCCLSLNGSAEEAGKENSPTPPGTLTWDHNSSGTLVVQCKDKSLKICTLKVKGKFNTAKNFYRGYLSKVPKSKWRFDS